MNEILLSEASLSEVLARVAYQLVCRRMRLTQCTEAELPAVLIHLTHQLDKHGWSALAFWTNAYAWTAAQGELPVFVRTAFIMRSRLGMPFRGVAFIDYKATRRRDPRVTNRGVTSTATKRGR